MAYAALVPSTELGVKAAVSAVRDAVMCRAGQKVDAADTWRVGSGCSIRLRCSGIMLIAQDVS